ncbi:hypothetical protein M0813_26253 [Anaeramoeba flamelloides]|uniref:Uncharacterized protein n=1 Tax=Anaeramoeba flamelloides TaxID=1746091 RepID=A0ABQ8Y0A2_9EUKA|nr:hypothetical protein M0813_26253 [Anaeramoeba flamelloides]
MSDLSFKQFSNTIEHTKQRIQKKTIIEKTAIQGLCLLGAPISEFQNYFFIDHLPLKTIRKRYYHEMKKKKNKKKGRKKKKKFHKTKKLVVDLDKPIGVNGELQIKNNSKKCPSFAFPSSYPFDLLKQQQLKIHQNKKQIQKVIVSNI